MHVAIQSCEYEIHSSHMMIRSDPEWCTEPLWQCRKHHYCFSGSLSCTNHVRPLSEQRPLQHAAIQLDSSSSCSLKSRELCQSWLSISLRYLLEPFTTPKRYERISCGDFALFARFVTLIVPFIKDFARSTIGDSSCRKIRVVEVLKRKYSSVKLR